MRLLYFSQYFPPEVGATQTRAYEMCRYLASRGHAVTVVTEVPNHPSGIIPLHYRGRLSERRLEEGIDVLRLWVSASPEKTFKSRMLFYLSYMGMGMLAGTLLRGDYDAVYATSPPLFVAPAGMTSAMRRKVPFVLEVRDLWPESAVALGELSNKPAIAAAEKLEWLLYARAARIVAVTEGIKLSLLERGLPSSKVALIPNGANTEMFRFDADGRKLLRTKMGLEGKFVAMYAGIHGIAQGLETLLLAAELLQDRQDIAFLFIGEGPRKAELLRLQDELALDNVRFLSEVPAAEMPAYLSSADCAIVPLRDQEIFRCALPSKMFEAWACSRPVVLSLSGEAERVLHEAGGGISTRPEDAAAIAGAIERLKANPDEAMRMGERGRRFVVSRFSRLEQARKLEELLESVVSETRRDLPS